MIDRDTIEYGGRSIEYEVRRSKRRKKTIEVKVSKEGVRVYAPWAASDRDLRRFVLDRASWILGHTDRFDAIEPLRFTDGETLPYLGHEVPMCFEATGVRVPQVRMSEGRFTVIEPDDLDHELRREQVGGAFLEWYKARAAEVLPEMVDLWWPVLGRDEKSRILIRNQKSRWGSCGPDGTLRFNWRVVMLDPTLIEYVVVHELAHLTIRNHSSDFWNLVHTVIPDAGQRRKHLRDIALGFRL